MTGIVGVEIFPPGREACRQRGSTAALRLNQKGIAAVDVLALPNDGIDLEPGSAAQARLTNVCSNPGAPSMTSRRRLRPAGLTSTLRVLFSVTASPSRGRDFHGVHGRLPRVGIDGEPLLDWRSVGGRRHAAAFEQFPAGDDAQLKGIAAEPAAGRRHLQVNGRVLEPLLPRRDPEDFAIAQPARRIRRRSRTRARARRRRAARPAPPAERCRRRPTARRRPQRAGRESVRGRTPAPPDRSLWFARAVSASIDAGSTASPTESSSVRNWRDSSGQQVEAQQRRRARDPSVAVGIRHAACCARRPRARARPARDRRPEAAARRDGTARAAAR